MENTTPAFKAEAQPILAMAFVNIQPLDAVYEAELSFSNGTLFPELNKPFWKENESI